MGGGIFIALWALGLPAQLPHTYTPGTWARCDAELRVRRVDAVGETEGDRR